MARGQGAPRPARACEQAARFWGEAHTEVAGDGDQERAQPLLSDQVPFCSACHQRPSRGRPTHWASLLSCGTAAVPLLCGGPDAWLRGQLGPARAGQASRTQQQPAAGSSQSWAALAHQPPRPTEHTRFQDEKQVWGPGCLSPHLSPEHEGHHSWCARLCPRGEGSMGSDRQGENTG